jgi:hypothetical protein
VGFRCIAKALGFASMFISVGVGGLMYVWINQDASSFVSSGGRYSSNI